MKIQILAALVFIAAIASVFAGVLYDIDYEPPAYTNGQQIGGGSTETISDSINGFTSQALLIHDGGGIAYSVAEPFTSGLHSISWNFTIPIEQIATSIINGQLDSLSGPILFDTTLSGGPNKIEYGSGFPQRPSVPFNVGQSYSFQILMNLDADFYSFWLDGNLLEDTVSIPSDATLEEVGFGQNQTLGLQAGIDNFRWEYTPIPEPGTLGLLGLGGLVVWFRRKNSAP